jgi:4-hydroxy-2-oxoheptanedioate aldolase
MMRENKLKNKISAGMPAIGAIMQINSPELIEIAGAAGFDYVIIDCEHGSFYLESLVDLIRAADAIGITPLVRTPNHDPSFIMRALDAGALGIVAPNISSAQQAKAVIAAARYKVGGNGGTRGACPGTRASWHQADDWLKYATYSNENILVWALIENEDGVKNIASIVSLDGLDGVMLGPFDLAHDLGFLGQVSHPDVIEAFSKVIESAKEHQLHVIASLFSSNSASMTQERNHWIAKGITIFSIGSDRRLIINAMKDRVKIFTSNSQFTL